jgi:hypothetical protein
MPAPDYPRSGFISKRSSRVKHVAIVDRSVSPAPFRPLCNQHSNDDHFVFFGAKGVREGADVWWVDLHGTHLENKNICRNCIAVAEEVWSAVTGVDTDAEDQEALRAAARHLAANPPRPPRSGPAQEARLRLHGGGGGGTGGLFPPGTPPPPVHGASFGVEGFSEPHFDPAKFNPADPDQFAD